MIIFYGLVAIIAAVSLVVSSLILVKIENFFKIENPKFSNALITVILSGLATFVIVFLLAVFKISAYSILGVFGSLLTFCIFLRHTYKISVGKSMKIWLVFTLVSIVISLVVVVPFKRYVASPFVVSGEAMRPLLNTGDYLVINKFNRNYERGDVVVYNPPHLANTFFIHRIVGLPGEKVEIKNRILFVNGKQQIEGIEGDTTVNLDKDEYFVLGDNYTRSNDSRFLGPIPKRNIQGKIFR